MAAGLLALLKRLIKTPPLHSQHSFRNLVEGQLRAKFPCIFCGSETLIIITGRFHCGQCRNAAVPATKTPIRRLIAGLMLAFHQQKSNQDFGGVPQPGS